MQLECEMKFDVVYNRLRDFRHRLAVKIRCEDVKCDFHFANMIF